MPVLNLSIIASLPFSGGREKKKKKTGKQESFFFSLIYRHGGGKGLVREITLQT